MSFGPFPASLANAIQQNFLERAFIDPLMNCLAYRKASVKEDFEARIGTTITKTKVGLMVPNITPLNPTLNTNIDNGLIPQNYGTEQYTVGVAQYPQPAPQINLMDDETTIASFMMRNTKNLGIAQGTCVDRLARNALLNAYMSGNTVVTQTLGAPNATINVDDTRGFQTVVANGNVVPVTNSNPLPVSINGTTYQIIAFNNDSTNISSAAITGGTSGTITASTTISTTNGTAGNYVIGIYAPIIIRPNARTTTAALQSSDLLRLQDIRAAVAYLENNAVPTLNGAYNCVLNSTQMNELYNDPEFQLIQRGTSVRDPAYKKAWIYNEFLNCRFVQTTETVVQAPQTTAPVPVNRTIQRAIIYGEESLVEEIFRKGLSVVANMATKNGPGEMQAYPTVTDVLGEKYSFEGFYMWLRGPIDRLGQIIDQTSNYVGGFVVPTDVTTTSAIIPTASSAYYKRAVILESA